MSNFNFKIDGPKFKDKEHYLTEEGYPLGTECYYYYIEFIGYIHFACGDTEIEALKNAMTFISEKWDKSQPIPLRK